MNGSVKEKDCSLQGQGHSYGSYTKNMVVSTTADPFANKLSLVKHSGKHFARQGDRPCSEGGLLAFSVFLKGLPVSTSLHGSLSVCNNNGAWFVACQTLYNNLM